MQPFIIKSPKNYARGEKLESDFIRSNLKKMKPGPISLKNFVNKIWTVHSTQPTYNLLTPVANKLAPSKSVSPTINQQRISDLQKYLH